MGGSFFAGAIKTRAVKMPGQHGMPGPEGEMSNTCAASPRLVLLFLCRLTGPLLGDSCKIRDFCLLGLA